MESISAIRLDRAVLDSRSEFGGALDAVHLIRDSDGDSLRILGRQRLRDASLSFPFPLTGG